MKNKRDFVVAGLVLVALMSVGVAIFATPRGAGAYDGFAQCLEEKGAIFYGAFWCPHCQNQKKLFGKSASLLPYVECSTPDGKSQKEICKTEKIEGYPTWVFADGSRESGVQSFELLAEKTACVLPVVPAN